MTRDEAEAARRLGDDLAVLARLDLRLVPVEGGYRMRLGRRTGETARFLVAYPLGLIALADRLSPAA